MRYILGGISVALILITAVYIMGINKRRAQVLLGRGCELSETTLPFWEYRDIYAGAIIRQVSWISFQSALLNYPVSIVSFNWNQMWFLTFDMVPDVDEHGQPRDTGPPYYNDYGITPTKAIWIIYITSLLH